MATIVRPGSRPTGVVSSSRARAEPSPPSSTSGVRRFRTESPLRFASRPVKGRHRSIVRPAESSWTSRGVDLARCRGSRLQALVVFVLHRSIAVLAIAFAPAFVACVPAPRAPVDLETVQARAVRFGLAGPRATICPGEPVKLDVLIDAIDHDGDRLLLRPHRRDL